MTDHPGQQAPAEWLMLRNDCRVLPQQASSASAVGATQRSELYSCQKERLTSAMPHIPTAVNFDHAIHR